MKLCAHEWSSIAHVGRDSRICTRCNEWEVDCDLERAKAAIVSLSKQRDDAYLDLREAREAHKAERDELEKHLSEAEDERDRTREEAKRFREACEFVVSRIGQGMGGLAECVDVCERALGVGFEPEEDDQ